MILTALAEYYDVLAAKGALPRTGWTPKEISYALSLSPEGELLQVIQLHVETQQGGKTVLRPQKLTVPEPQTRTVAVAPNFLQDNAAYLLGIDSKGKPERAQKCFLAAKELHIRLLSGVESPAAKAITAYFESWKPETAEEHPKLAELLSDLKKGGNIVFRVAGKLAQDEPLIAAAWQNAYASSPEAESSACLVTGELSSPARLHPVIKGVRGAQAMGTLLVSFNAESYNSYGKDQGANAPVSERAASAYGMALNYLLDDREHTVQLGDATVVFWAKNGQEAPRGMMAALVGANNEVADSDLKSAMSHVSEGLPTGWKDEKISPDSEFYILGLSPNAARLSVRFFLRDSFGAFVKRMKEHQDRLEIVRPAFDNREQLSFWQLLRETVNEKSRDKTPLPVMAGELLRAVLTGGRYPATLLNGVMLRIRAEHEVTRGRAAIIKAYYSKNKIPSFPEEVLNMSLVESTNPAYNLGILFSVLEEIQENANPEINTTIKDKFFTSASATPSRVFPHLINLAQHHIRKIDKEGWRIRCNKKLAHALAAFGEEYPARLTLTQQGSFQLGYYHKTQNRFEKKGDEANV
jgi:CRISPR-associated protein Csd1